ncbi:MAG: hypothetical protein WC985_06190 [Thermoplasmata archaeon]
MNANQTTPAEDIAAANYFMAIDQVGSYDSLEEALNSYQNNAIDSANEEKADWMNVNALFIQLVRANHPELNW